jgi:hypothetical protein
VDFAQPVAINKCELLPDQDNLFHWLRLCLRNIWFSLLALLKQISNGIDFWDPFFLVSNINVGGLIELQSFWAQTPTTPVVSDHRE